MQALIDFFGVNNFVPHGYCLSWNPALLWTTVLSDATMVLAYGSYPIAVTYFVWKRKDLEYRWLYLAFFNGFILTCASTHLISAVTVWLPLYWLAAYIKALAAMVAVATVFAVWWVIPRALKLPSPAQLEVQRGTAQYTRSLIEASLDPLVTINPEGKITDVNIATELVTGRRRGELIGTDFSDYFTEPDKARDGYRQVLQEGSVTDYPLALRHQDGHITDVLYNASLYRDETGKEIGVFAAARDVTRLKRAENELRSASLYTRSLIEASLDPLVTISPEGKITDVNVATEQVTGMSRDKLTGTDFSDYFTEPDKAREGYQRVLLKGAVTDYPLAIRHRNGHITEVLYNASLYRDEAGKVTGVFAAARDVTERNKAENTLREYAAIIESSDDAIIGKTLQGIITSWNDGAMRLFGYSREEMLGKSIMLLIPAPYQREEEMIMERIRNGDSVKHFETVRRCKDGKLIDISVTVSPIRDKDGNIAGASKVARDISERKKAEELLRAASLYTRSLIEASLDPLVTISPEGKITDVNQATEQVTGRNRSELIGTDFSDYFTEPDKARDGYQQVLKEGSVTDYPLALRHQDGHITGVLYNASLYRDEAGKAVGVFAAARDVTERHKAEQALLALKNDLENRVIARTAELEAANKELEAFSYSVSHDLRTPLRAIDGFSLMLLEDYESKLDDEGKRLLNVVRNNTKRMSQLIDDILHFSRAGRTEMNLSEVDMEALVRDVLDGLQPLIAERKLHIDLGGLPKAACDRAMMHQVIENLLSNAIKFTRKNDEARIDIGGRIEDGKAIYYVKDNGVGFDMRYVEKLFGVFQRLHGVEEFEGTGIGLAIVKRIVTRHGGTVWAEGETGKGAAIYFSIPLPSSMPT
jgi:PAS domain S-box-containing protein